MAAPARPPLTPVGSALAGALGAVFANAAVYPLDTVKTRIQALPDSTTSKAESAHPTHPADAKSATVSRPRNAGLTINPIVILHRLLGKLKRWDMLTMLIRIVKTEGVTGAFKGFSASMINTFSQQFAYFFFHTFLRSAAISYRSRIASSPTASLGTAAELSLGAAAGGLAQIFTIPVAVIATRQQLWTPSSASGNDKAPSLVETARQVVAEGGVTALWTGLKPGLVLTVNPAITYGVFERLKSWRLSSAGTGTGSGKLAVGEAFWMGVASKTLATVVTFPYILAKVRLQARPAPRSIADQTTGKDGASYAAIAAAPPAPDAPVVEAGEPSSSASVSASTLAPNSSSKAARPKENGALQLLQEIYKEHGVAGWYQGLGAQIIKAVLCQGILFVSKDQFEGWAAEIIGQLHKVQAKLA